SAYGVLPPGLIGPVAGEELNQNGNWSSGPFVGMMALLLPYMEQDNIYRQLTSGANAININPDGPKGGTFPHDSWFQPPGYPNPTAYALAATVIKPYQCPSFSGGPGTTVIIGGVHGWNDSGGAYAGAWYEDYQGWPASVPAVKFAVSNYVG